MVNYQKLYTMLFNAATDALEALEELNVGRAKDILRQAAEGGSLASCLQLATAASALAVTRPGAADSIPSYEEVQAFLRA